MSSVFDVVGIGIGPFNLGLAALLEKVPEIKAVFFEQKPRFEWHGGMLIEGTTLQVPFFADLVTMADPTHPLSFLNYLHEQGRLYHFYFLERFHVPRREYSHYCQWAAEHLDTCRFGCEVTDVRLHREGEEEWFSVAVADHESGRSMNVLSRHLVLGVGSVPFVADRFQHLPENDVFHSAHFLDRLDRCRQAKSITIIGSGQSAAEIFLHLLQEQGEYGYRLDWFTRSAGFFPMEYSKLGLEHFSPDYTRYFYGLPQQKKDVIRAGQDLLYKGISAQTIADIYDSLYEATVAGKRPAVRLLANTEVREVRAGRNENGTYYHLSCHHVEQGTWFAHDSEVVILATGYRHVVPDCIRPLHSLIRRDSLGRYEVEADYRLTLREKVNNRIYIQNGELHTHGVGAPDLGLGAYRNSVIINSLTGREVYPVRPRNVFQQFGIQ
ncbi:MAG: lysine N(6)-hydroxylase/L-ornithine N(5)-oxygenase family protein [Brevibacillus sp.]|nr:lysine N(6)-hydroxylase/L-ornithine N(5)-oxygenase family protein [Brevibacillus sp.]